MVPPALLAQEPGSRGLANRIERSNLARFRSRAIADSGYGEHARLTMMTAVLLGWTLASAQPAGDVATTIQDPKDRQAALCVPALSAGAGGQVASISVSRAKPLRPRTIPPGGKTVLQRPPPPPPCE